MNEKLRRLGQLLRMSWRGFVGGYRAGQEEVRTGRVVTTAIDVDAERVYLAVLEPRIAPKRK